MILHIKQYSMCAIGFICHFGNKIAHTSCVPSVLSVILQSFPCFWFSSCLHQILVFRDTYHTVKTLSAKSTWKFTFLHIYVDTKQFMDRNVMGVLKGLKAVHGQECNGCVKGTESSSWAGM